MLFLAASLLTALATGTAASPYLAARDAVAPPKFPADASLYCNITNTIDARVYKCHHEQHDYEDDDCVKWNEGDLQVYSCPPAPKDQPWCDEEYRPTTKEYVALCNTEHEVNKKCEKHYMDQGDFPDRWAVYCPMDVVASGETIFLD